MGWLSSTVFDHYFLYEEMVEYLVKVSMDYPRLCKMHSIGKTLQDKEIWLLEVSNMEKGDPDRKPGFYIDGNTHASEVTGSMVCLKTIHELLTGYDEDPFITRLLDTRTFYINPRVDPDGAELFLTTPETFGGGARMYPLTDEEWDRAEGLVPEDMDGDSDITEMRVEDPNGEWKQSKVDPRLIERRLPEDVDGPFYKVYTEGRIKGYRGQEVRMAPRKYNLNLNRNFPGDFEPHPKQWGAGQYPLSEPETRAVADFWRSHPNIAGLMTYHTHGGSLPRVFDAKPDEYFTEIECEKDLEIFRELGDVATRMTGYKQVSSFDDFTRDKRKPRHGCTDGYAYLHLGVLGFCMELWDMPGHAGLPGFKERGGIEFRWPLIKEEEAKKLLKWNDEALKGEGFKPWTKYSHPQLGEVEIGGWKSKYTWRNPPQGDLLLEEVERTYKFALIHASLLPELEIIDSWIKDMGDGVYKVGIKVVNNGFQATCLTQMAEKLKIAKPVIATAYPGEGVKILSERPWIDIGILEGRAEKLPGLIRPSPPGEGHAKTAEWLLKVKKPSKVDIRVTSEKAGETSVSLTIP